MKFILKIILYLIIGFYVWLCLYLCIPEYIENKQYLKLDKFILLDNQERFFCCNGTGSKYFLEIPYTGFYTIKINGKNSKPAPVLLRVSFSEDKFSYILKFDKNNNSYEIKNCNILGIKGKRNLSITFINDYYIPAYGIDRNGYINYVAAEPLKKNFLSFILTPVFKFIDFYLSLGKYKFFYSLIIPVILLFFIWEPYLLSGIIILSIIFRFEQDIFDSFTLVFPQVLVLIFVIVFSLRYIFKKDKIFWLKENRIIFAGIVIFLFTQFLSYLVAVDITASIKQTLRWLEMLSVYFCISIVNNKNEIKKDKSIFLNSVILASFVMALYGLYQLYINKNNVFYIHPKEIFFSVRNYICGPFGSTNHNYFAVYLGLLFPFYLLYFLFCARPVKSVKKATLLVFLNRIVLIIFFVFAVYAFILCFSRSSTAGIFISVFIVSVLLYRLNNKKILRIKLLSFLFFLIFLIAIPFFNYYFLNSKGNTKNIMIVNYVGFFKKINQYLAVRTELWNYAIKAIKDRPLLGVGIGNFFKYWDKYFPQCYRDNYLDANSIFHNLYLYITAETGFIGLVGFLCFIFFNFYFLILKINQKNNFEYKLTGSCFLISFIFLLFPNFFDLLTGQNVGMMWLLIAGSGINILNRS